jgi:hypothetical protein
MFSVHLGITLNDMYGEKELNKTRAIINYKLNNNSRILRSCSWLGLINVYKFPLDNFHLQDPSSIMRMEIARHHGDT